MTKASFINIIEQQLRKDQYPRLQMMGIVALTGLIGFLASFVLLKLGVTQMVVRYPVAVLIGYVGFLGLIRLWMYWQQSDSPESNPQKDQRNRSNSSFDLDLPNLGGGGGGGNAIPKDFGGGSFSGGGAGGGYGNALSAQMASTPQPILPVTSSTTDDMLQNLESADSGGSDSGSGSSSGGGFDLGGLDDGAVIVLALIVIGAVLCSFFYVIYIAPALFAELMIDGALATGLYRSMRQVERRNWLATVLAKTWWIVLVVCLIVGFCGYTIQASMPEAISIGDVFAAKG